MKTVSLIQFRNINYLSSRALFNQNIEINILFEYLYYIIYIILVGITFIVSIDFILFKGYCSSCGLF